MALSIEGKRILEDWIHDRISERKPGVKKNALLLKTISTTVCKESLINYNEMTSNSISTDIPYAYVYESYRQIEKEININKFLKYLLDPIFTKVLFKNDFYYVSSFGILDNKLHPILLMGRTNIEWNSSTYRRCYNGDHTLYISSTILQDSSKYLYNQIIRFVIPYIIRNSYMVIEILNPNSMQVVSGFVNRTYEDIEYLKTKDIFGLKNILKDNNYKWLTSMAGKE